MEKREKKKRSVSSLPYSAADHREKKGKKSEKCFDSKLDLLLSQQTVYIKGGIGQSVVVVRGNPFILVPCSSPPVITTALAPTPTTPTPVIEKHHSEHFFPPPPFDRDRNLFFELTDCLIDRRPSLPAPPPHPSLP